MERWSGKVALVTGASAGIGAQICTDLLKHGLKVIAVARNVDKIGRNVQVGQNAKNLCAIKCDLSVEEEILNLFRQIRENFKCIDVCINNAGFSTNCPLLSGNTDEWRKMFNVNVLALSICTRESIKLMQENDVKEGQIIHISSIGGHLVVKGGGFYCGTKYMVRALTEGLRLELRAIKSPIRISSISPGAVKTEFLYNIFPEDHDKADALYNAISTMKSEDISALVVTILSAPPHVEVHDILVRPTNEQPFPGL